MRTGFRKGTAQLPECKTIACVNQKDGVGKSVTSTNLGIGLARHGKLPTGAPEMNPMEQIWREIRSVGFANVMLPSLAAVLNRLDETIRSLSRDTVSGKAINRICFGSRVTSYPFALRTTFRSSPTASGTMDSPIIINQ